MQLTELTPAKPSERRDFLAPFTACKDAITVSAMEPSPALVKTTADQGRYDAILEASHHSSESDRFALPHSQEPCKFANGRYAKGRASRAAAPTDF